MQSKAKQVEQLIEDVSNQSFRQRDLLDFLVGSCALMFGNISAVLLFYALAEKGFFLYSVITMGVLVGNAIWAKHQKEINFYHYMITFVVAYVYGLVMFLYGDNEKGVIIFGLVYPVLSVYILKSFFGNLLIGLELVTSIMAALYVNPVAMNTETLSIYIVIYVMFWGFANAMESARYYLMKKILEQKERLERYANYDQLTSLHNRRYFYECIANQKLQPAEPDSIAITIMDLDNFKAVNDTYGHNVGDEVLVEAAKRIRNNSRSTDIDCRWGGEEFLIWAHVDSLEAAEKYGKKICDAIGKTPMEISEGRQISITGSFGTVFVPNREEMNLTEAIRLADENLYRAKREGKNRVITSNYKTSTGWKE